MDIVIWIGAAVTLLGVIGLMSTVVMVGKAKKSSANDEEMRARLQKIIPMNFAALAVSMIGLMAVIVGISLG
ncbi:hypothetical protein HCZ30_15650 [Marivivens donghaensis]|uniref:HIG1 domain-containing protein n=1 Tax=Marivivens donghaensis TaxID=1699413 RepID=A0ABX0W0K8_9RHOB|nr:hypothetical protein [Marivivens donghaensis]NIY73865.1 hypothetical protein [Marivivens donghaensis]